MENKRYLFTSESVGEGHPDKLCDQISDAILDECLRQDKESHVACETFATTGSITVMGEITTSAHVDIPSIARQVALDIGRIEVLGKHQHQQDQQGDDDLTPR